MEQNKYGDDFWVGVILFLSAFALGYLVANAILDKRPVTEEDMIELNRSQYYEQIMEQETLESYIERLKQRRTEDEYKYSDADFVKYADYITDCWKTNLSVYKCLEWMYFATI